MDKKTAEYLGHRINALYHNCHSSAAFARADALKSDDEICKTARTHEAIAYEVVAGWLEALIKDL